MADFFISLVGGIPVTWRVFILSMIPITELRAALPLGVVWGMSVPEAYWWSVFGNFMPVLPALFILKLAFRWLIDKPKIGKPLRWLAAYNERKGSQVKRYGLLGLFLLVAVPIPGTGIWTGCIVAAAMGMHFWPAALAITVGMMVAGLLVSLLVSGVVAVSGMDFGLEIALIVLAVALIVFFVFYFRKKKKNRADR